MKYVSFTFAIFAIAGCSESANGPQAIEPNASFTPQINVETIENPQYREWANFKPGTTVVHRSTTGTDGVAEKTVTTTTYKLVEIAKDSVALTMQTTMVRFDGYKTEVPENTVTCARLLPIPTGMKKADFEKKKADREETIRAAGREIACRVTEMKTRSEAGEGRNEVWWSESVPGGLVKSISVTPVIKKTTTIELMEWK